MRFEAIRTVHPTVVTLRGENDARDANNNAVALNEELITVELDKLVAEKEAERLAEEAKAAKEEALNSIVVTTQAGNTFDADDQGRASMNEAISSASFLGLTENEWKLADNSVVIIGIDELREALALGIQAKGAIILGA